MTPLNNILGNSGILVKRFRQLHQLNREHMVKLGIHNKIASINKQNEETLSIINSIN